jgi:hypothetical protein
MIIHKVYTVTLRHMVFGTLDVLEIIAADRLAAIEIADRERPEYSCKDCFAARLA